MCGRQKKAPMNRKQKSELAIVSNSAFQAEFNAF